MRYLLLGFIITSVCMGNIGQADTPVSAGNSPELLRQVSQLKAQNGQLQQRVQQLQSQLNTLQQNNQQQDNRLQRIETWIIDRSRPGKILNP